MYFENDDCELRICDACGKTIREGWTDSEGGALCSDDCVDAAAWIVYDRNDDPVILTSNNIGPIIEELLDDEEENGTECFVYWTEWEESPEVHASHV